MDQQELIRPNPCPWCGRTPNIQEWKKIHGIKRLAIMCPVLCVIGEDYRYWIEVEDDNVTEKDLIKLWNEKTQSL